MNDRLRCRLGLLALALALPWCPSGGAEAGDPPPPPSPVPAAPPAGPGAPGATKAPTPKPKLPDGIVARVRGKDVPRDEFLLRLADRVRPELDDPRSAPSTVLRILVEESVVRQEAARLGIVVTSDDYAKRYNDIDEKVRASSSGEQTLADVIRLQKMEPDEFRSRLEVEILKDRIASHKSYLGATLPKDEAARLAQVEVVMGQLMKKARVERAGVPAGVVAQVNGVPVTDAQLGQALYKRLAESEVRRHLQEHCMTILLDQEGLDFTAAQVDEALALDRPLYDRMRVEAITPEKRSLSFDDFLQLRYGTTLAELRTSRYRRGLFALRQRFWKGVTDAEVGKAWQAGASGVYGPSIVLTDVVVSFTIPKAVVEPVKRRTRDEALRLANDFVRRGRAGERPEAIVKEIKESKDRGMAAERRTVIDVGNDLRVFEAAKALEDGTWSEPVEGLAEFHVLYRESSRPAPTFEEIRAVVRQTLVDQKAQNWLQDTLRDEVVMDR